jgi:hypothetical protein
MIVPEPSPSRSQGALPQPVWFTGLPAAREGMPWLWEGYLAPGNLTLLTGLWKSGKTTLVALLLARRHDGRPLLGRPVTPGKSAVVTEESPAHWQPRVGRLGLGGDVCFFFRPFAGKPERAEWLGLVDELGRLRRAHGVDLVVIDPLATFLPGHDESNAGPMLEALLPLQRLSGQGVAVLVLHHPRKGEAAPGKMARGSGALSGCADILIEMGGVGRGAPEGRRRRLRAWSRHEQTPHDLLIELTAEGTDYLCHGDYEAEEVRRHGEVLCGLLRGVPGGLTREEVRAAWPGGRPAANTVWRWLEAAVGRGLLARVGSGRRGEPFRYRLAETPALPG